MQNIKVLLTTSRPISWVNTAYPFAAGYLLLGGGIDARLVLGTLFFLIPYNLLMYGINDVEDFDSDMRNPRKGGVEGAITPKRFHRMIITASIGSSLPFVLLLMSMGDLVSNVVLAGVLFFVVAYSVRGLRFKEVPFLDSLTSSLHFVGPLLYAMSLVGSSRETLIATIAFLLWGMASQAFGAIQDIVPDRAAGIHSIATKIGARKTVWYAFTLYLLASGLVLLLGLYAIAVAAIAFAYALNVIQFKNVTDANSAQARLGWKRFLILNYLAGAVVTISCLLASFSV